MRLSARLPVAAVTALALFAQQANPQTPAPAKPAEAAPVIFTSNSTLIVETVSVTDKAGKPVEGLKKEDFTITEDNKPQQVYYLEYQKFDDSPITEEAKPTVKPSVAAQIEPEKPGGQTMKYQNRRLLAMYFDMAGMQDIDQIRALSAAQNFIKKNLQAADLVSIMEFTDGAVVVKQDFTDDREALLQVIDKIALAAQGFDVDNSDAGAAFGQDNSEFNIFNTDHQLSAVQTAVQMLGRVTGKKSLLYFASGLTLNGLDNQAQMTSLSNAAIRNNVTLNPVDARGLVAFAPMGNASQGGGGGMGLYTGSAAAGVSSGFNKSQDALYAMAADTGGKAFFDNNDLSKGIVNVQQAVTSYYVLSYFTTNGTLDGKARRVKITVNRPDLKLEYRQMYYAGKTFDKFTALDKERQLEEALMLGDPITDLPIAVEVNYFQLNRAEYFIPVNVKIPGSELVLAKRGGAQHTTIDLIGEIKDEYGTTVTNLREKYDIPLTADNAAQLATRPIMYDGGFTTLPGNYVIKVLVRDDETGRIGTFISKFNIPNLMKEEKRLPISSVVLSSQRSDIKESLATAKSKIAAQSPLVENGFKLVPSVTHVFNRSKEMFVYLQAYERANTTTETQPLVAFVTLYKGQVKVFETQPVQVMDGFDAKSASKAVPIRLSFPMEKLAPGRYECQVTVLDPTNQKANFWKSPIVLVQ